MTPDRYDLMLQTLSGEPPPPPRAMAGTVHRCFDAPLSDAELATITSCSELALIAGISRQAAYLRLRRARALIDSID